MLGPPPIPPFITITPAVEGVGQWVHPTVYEFTLAEKVLQGGITYHVALDPTLQAVDGTRLDQPFEWTFTVVEPQVLHITPTRSTWNAAWLRNAVKNLHEAAVGVRVALE